jgi:hypothetical protein
VLPEGGIFFHARDKRHYRKLAAQQAESWYKHIMAQRDAPNGALCLVTGCLKTKKWGITTFDQPSEAHDVIFTSKFLSPDEYYWKPAIPNVTKIGPVSGDISRELWNQCTFICGYRIMLRQDVYKELEETVGVLADEEEATSNQQPKWPVPTTHGHSSKLVEALDKGKGAGSSMTMESQVGT